MDNPSILYRTKMMNQYMSQGVIADERFYFRFRFPDTIQYYGAWLSPVECITDSDRPVISVPQRDFDFRKAKWGHPINAFTEFDLSMFRVSDHLLSKGKCVFHGAAFLWKDQAFIFTAPSGTGKTTQLNYWRKLWGEEIHVMNGDKPILQLEADGHVTVLPSPWRGKENWSDENISAPLGGVIILEQAGENKIRRVNSNESAAFLFTSLLASFESKEIIESSCKFINGILRSTPVWKLQNIGDLDSAILTKDTIEKEGLCNAVQIKG